MHFSDQTLRDLAAKISPFALCHSYVAAEAHRQAAAEIERYRLAERARLGLPPYDMPLPRLSASDIRQKLRRLDALRESLEDAEDP